MKNKDKILLHICCGPCTVFPATKLKGLKVPFDCYFYNPNITDGAEREKRFVNAQKLSKILKFKLLSDITDKFTDLPRHTGRRVLNCGECYFERLEPIFEYAKQENYKGVTTTLLCSPYQNTELISNKLKELSIIYNIPFVLYNFKDGFYQGQKRAREMGIYCQKFCGCFASYQAYMQRLLKENEIND